MLPTCAMPAPATPRHDADPAASTAALRDAR